MTTRRDVLVGGVAAAIAGSHAGHVRAQDYPAKPVRILRLDRSRRDGRHARALAGIAPDADDGPAVLCREPRRRRQYHRHRPGREIAAGRLHLPALRRHHHHQSHYLQEATLRRAARPRADHAAGVAAERAGGASLAAVQDAGGVHRRGQGEARPDQLRVGRRRQQSASLDGAPEVHDRHRRRARAVQGRRPGDVGPAGRARRVDGVERRVG